MFILQVEGEKKWVVDPATVPYPTTKIPLSTQPQPAVFPYIDRSLDRGDELYIPRGHWHYEIAGDRPSLHLTIDIENQSGRSGIWKYGKKGNYLYLDRDRDRHH
ncbi:hypothetical protein C7B77_25770 [Chamaesiphon polymorphus CCALA 037]|uniref:JmjC domain-containing protein n=1 Tax=Chamaesiphon polymorphus CCALA 037 TaxID=2107692 RepID=A0A2T1FGV1_9CYAN|nr:hypothetical protein C7B77_25770 [Chamaesiphon polymorphus CCALA 037]